MGGGGASADRSSCGGWSFELGRVAAPPVDLGHSVCRLPCPSCVCVYDAGGTAANGGPRRLRVILWVGPAADGSAPAGVSAADGSAATCRLFVRPRPGGGGSLNRPPPPPPLPPPPPGPQLMKRTPAVPGQAEHSGRAVQRRAVQYRPRLTQPQARRLSGCQRLHAQLQTGNERSP